MSEPHSSVRAARTGWYGKPQGGIYMATGFARRELVITGMTPDMPIAKNGGMRERGGLKNDNDNVALSPVGALPF